MSAPAAVHESAIFAFSVSTYSRTGDIATAGVVPMTVAEVHLLAVCGPFRGPAGTFVVFPPDVVHGFDNDGTENARFFNLHMPASGFGDYMRGRKPDFDQHDPPEDGGTDPASIVTARLTVKLTDDAQRDAALALPGTQLFDPGMGRVMREWVLVPKAQSDEWERLVEQAVSGVGSTEPPKSGGAGFAGAGAGSG